MPILGEDKVLYYTTDEVSQMLKISRSAVCNKAKRNQVGKLGAQMGLKPSFDLKVRFFSESDVELLSKDLRYWNNSDRLSFDDYGEVACGAPIAIDAVPKRVYIRQRDIQREIRNNNQYFLLHARGDSMKEMGIDDGDTLLMYHESIYRWQGDIVAVSVDGDYTLKQIYKHKDKRQFELRPFNPAHKSLFVDSFDSLRIRGVFIENLKEVNYLAEEERT